MGNYEVTSSYFGDVNETVLHVHVKCKNKDEKYNILIDTYEDPYLVYYSGSRPNEQEEKEFEKSLFEYLKNQYPEHF